MTANILDGLLQDALNNHRANPDIVAIVKAISEERAAYQKQYADEIKKTVDLVIAGFEEENKKLQAQLDCAMNFNLQNSPSIGAWTEE